MYLLCFGSFYRMQAVIFGNGHQYVVDHCLIVQLFIFKMLFFP